MRGSIVAVFLVLATSAAALATPADDVAGAFAAWGKATSYHMAVITAKGQQMDGDFVRPDKMHLTMGPMEMITLADGTFVKMNGSWMRLPRPMPQMQSGALTYVEGLGRNPKDTTVEDLGTKSVDGASYHAYKVTPNGGKPSTVYVDGAGLVARVDVTEGDGTSIVRFSKYNAPVTIVAPI